jgi:hypothetical protein
VAGTGDEIAEFRISHFGIEQQDNGWAGVAALPELRRMIRPFP